MQKIITNRNILLEEALMQEVFSIMREKHKQGVEPIFATFRDLEESCKAALNQLCKDKKIKSGKTINDIYFVNK